MTHPATNTVVMDERIYGHLRDEIVIFFENLDEADDADEKRDIAEGAGYDSWEEFELALRSTFHLPAKGDS
jgi:hypothetical protein